MNAMIGGCVIKNCQSKGNLTKKLLNSLLIFLIFDKNPSEGIYKIKSIFLIEKRIIGQTNYEPKD